MLFKNSIIIGLEFHAFPGSYHGRTKLQGFSRSGIMTFLTFQYIPGRVQRDRYGERRRMSGCETSTPSCFPAKPVELAVDLYAGCLICT